MLSVEDQVGRIADAAFDETVPAIWTPPSRGANPGRSRQRSRWVMAVASCVLAVGLVGGLVLLAGDVGQAPAPPISSPAPSGSLPAGSTVPATTTEPPTSSTTIAPSTPVALPVPVRLLSVVPYGVTPTEDPFFQVRETNVNSTAASDATGPGDVVLTYDVGIGFNPDGRSSTLVQVSPTSTDGQLAIEVSCLTDGCLDLEPVNDFGQTSVHLTVRRTEADLTEGAHWTEFELHFDDGTIGTFSIGQFGQPEPSVVFAQRVASSTGPPSVVQEVFGQGIFAYHAIDAFDSIWVLDRNSGKVTRIDATTGAVLATIDAGDGGRLTASNEFVYTSGSPIYRIDPRTNTASPIPGANGTGIAATDASVVFTGDYANKQIQRINTDGSVTTLDLPSERWMDMTITNGMVWALSQTPSVGRLIAFDADSGELRYDIPIAVSGQGSGYPVRLVSDDTSIVVGADGGLGGNGELFVIDPSSGTIEQTVALATRPEGIVLTPNHIWTSAAILDRNTLEVLYEGSFGFTITRGPDGSIWGTSGLPNAQSGTFVARRTAPGDYKD